MNSPLSLERENIFTLVLLSSSVTDKLYYSDMNLKEFDATILEVQGNEIILDRTAFYPTGGGQPNDTGTLEIDGLQYKVVDVKKNDGDVIHVLEDSRDAKKGAKVHGKIDWDRRYTHMRYHTAIHVLDGVVTKNYNEEGMLTGGQIYLDRARVDFDMQNFNRDLVEKIIDEANKFIAEGHGVHAKEISGKEASSIPNLARTGPGRELISNLDVVRLIGIDSLDEQSDGGTHVSNTSEVGKISLKKIENKGKRNKRVEFTLEE